MWIDPVYDRTIGDVSDAKEKINHILLNGWDNLTQQEKNDFLDGYKGCYNFTDMNRVGIDVNIIINELILLGYNLEEKNANENWGYTDIPPVEAMTPYLQNITYIPNNYLIIDELPQTMTNLTYEGANQIEKFLFDTYNYIQNQKQIFVYSGTVYSAQPVNYVAQIGTN